jgi:tetratricopeptide (TPR) repeat protein
LDLSPESRRTRSPRTDRSARARRVRLGAGALALALAAGAAAAETPRALVAAGQAELAQLLAPAPRRRAVVYTSVGVGLACVPIALLALRRRRRERARARMVREQCARVPEVFEAARVTRPLRRSPEPPVAERREPDGLPPLGPVSPEVASRAAALRAAAVREAAARATLLRTASERSETRRRAAALRARARRDQRIESVALAVLEAGPAAKPSAPPPLALPAPRSAAPAAAPEPSAAAAPPIAPVEPATPPAPPGPALAVGRGTGRVAILRGSGPLTFEWLERCLARDPEDLQARLDLCTALLVAERFADAERVAREGLERDATDGRLLLRLSEALSGLERNDEALETAVRAVRGHRSRKAILHLTRLSALAHRFAPGDGPRLRKALESRPHEPVFLHALGVFEALHGSPREALQWLRLALRQERTPRWRRVVSREIARLRAAEISGTPEPRRAAG